jgi:MFS family permease
MSISAGINFHGFGNFIIPLGKEFGWTRGTVSLVFSLSRLEAGLLGPIEGYLVDRFGPRRLMLIGLPLMALGYVLMSKMDVLAVRFKTDPLVAFFIVFILFITLGNSMGMSTPITAAVANWFNKKRGLAFGVMWSGVGLGGFFVPAVGWLVENLGWRSAALTIGIVLLAVGVPIASIIRHRPEPYGYLPDGEAPKPGDGTARPAGPLQPDLSQDFSAREALKTWSFWSLTLSIMARSLVSGGVGLHLVPYFVGLGASPVNAAWLAGLVGVISIPGRFGLSAIGDYVNRRYVMAVSLAMMTVAVVLMARAGSIAGVLPVLVMYSAAQGGVSVVPHSLYADYFGRRAYATIHGWRSIIQMSGIIAGPIISGYVFDSTGSYETAFMSFSGATLVSMVLVLMAKPPKRPQRASR